MTADQVLEIRRAAELMRERAAEAERPPYGSDHANQPWCPDWTWQAVRHVNRNMDMECPAHPWDSDSEGECNTWGRYAGYHIASWHPGVALAVADWLDYAAEVDDFNTQRGYSSAAHGWVTRATNVARAYLGGAS